MTLSESSAAALARVPFGDFLQLLRRNGFSIGLRHYARAVTVLDRLGPECGPSQIRTLLCPVFATTAEQQERFYRLFDQWFPLFGEVAREVQAPAAATIEASVAETEPPAPHAPQKRRRNYLIPAAAAAVLVLVIVSLQLVARSRVPSPESPRSDSAVPAAPSPVIPPDRVVPQPPTDARPAAEPPARPPVPSTKWRLEISRPVAQLLAILVIVTGFATFEWRNFRRRRLVLERQRRERPPLVWPIRVESVASPLTETSDFYTAARRLRDRQTGERSRLDIESTISATIRALGFPMLQYVLETRPPEYLVLIERASARDHQTRLYQHLVESLAAEGVHATVYCYDDDPRICDPVGGGHSAMLSELRRRYPTYRLLLFGTGDGLIDPITGRRKSWVADALNWPDRALLTPEPLEAWGAREVALASHLVVLPATINGLQAVIDHFQMPTRQAVAGSIRRPSRAPAIPELSGGDHVRLLRRYVGERGLQWVCACAVYPELQWNLTLHLGMLPELGDRTIDDELLLKLVRLPWYRTGLIPDDARAVLLRVIRPEVERAARGALITLLERNPAPAETIASSRYELDLVVQKLALHGSDRGRRRELMRIAERMPRDRVVRELAVLRLTEQDPPSRLAMRLPGRLRHVFFQSGLPVFGLTTGARSLVGLALVASVMLAGRDRSTPDSSTTVRTDDSTALPVSLAGGPELPTAADTLSGDSATVAVRTAITRELDRLREAIRAKDTTAISRVVTRLTQEQRQRLAAVFQYPVNVTLFGSVRSVASDAQTAKLRWVWTTQFTADRNKSSANAVVLDVSRTGSGNWIVEQISSTPLIPLDIRLSDLSLSAGDETMLRAVALLPSGAPVHADVLSAVRWATADSTIATVTDQGVVRALRPGKVWVSALIETATLKGEGPSLITIRDADIARSVASGASADARLQRAIAHYRAFNLEAAIPILDSLVRQEATLLKADAALTYKYLAASHAVLARREQAVTLFGQALDNDPFTDLNPTEFAAAELSALMEARGKKFRLGVRVPNVVFADSTNRFFVVTTQRALLRFELVNRDDSTQRLVLYNGPSDGMRQIAWNALLADGTLAGDAARRTTWEARASTTPDRATGLAATATEAFRLVPRGVTTVVASPPDSAAIRIGSRTSGAMLYINNVVQGALDESPRTVMIRAQVPTHLSIRAVGCVPWDTTVALNAGSLETIGSRAATCPSVAAIDSAANARSARQLQDAINRASRQLSSNWSTQRSGGVLRIGGVNVELEAVDREVRYLGGTGSVMQIGAVCGSSQLCEDVAAAPRPIGSSALVRGIIRFEERGSFGTMLRQQRRFALTFVHEADSWVLRRIVVGDIVQR